MKIKDITIKKIENMPPGLLLKVNEVIDLMYDSKQKPSTISATDRKTMMQYINKAGLCLKDIKGGLSEDIIRIEREEKV